MADFGLPALDLSELFVTGLLLLFVLNSAQSSGNNWKFHEFLFVKNYVKESLLPNFFASLFKERVFQ